MKPELLLKHLEKAVEERCEDEIGIVFSGGVDSTLVATLAAKHADVVAYAVGSRASKDLEAIRQSNLHFDIKFIHIDEKDIEKNVDKVLKVLGVHNPVRVGATFVPYLVSKEAAKDGVKVMLPGQGADEEFGGYWRYMPVLRDEGYRGLGELLEKDTKELAKDLIKGDIDACELNGVELRTPFLDKDFIEFALSIDPKEKIKRVKKGVEGADEYEGGYYVRKYILKKAAEKAGVPPDIVWRAKKAAQYGSGVHRLLENVAKGKGYMEKAKAAGHRGALSMFLEERFKRL